MLVTCETVNIYTDLTHAHNPLFIIFHWGNWTNEKIHLVVDISNQNTGCLQNLIDTIGIPACQGLIYLINLWQDQNMTVTSKLLPQWVILPVTFYFSLYRITHPYVAETKTRNHLHFLLLWCWLSPNRDLSQWLQSSFYWAFTQCNILRHNLSHLSQDKLYFFLLQCSLLFSCLYSI